MATQTFTDPTTFTIEVSTSPATAGLQFSGGPSGTLTVAEGGTLDLPRLTTVVTNTGQQSGSYTVTMGLSGPISGSWYAASLNGNAYGTPPTTVGPFTLAPGATATIVWGTQFEDAVPSQAGTYTTTAVVDVT